MSSSNKNLNTSKNEKYNEFYTLYEEIEKEMKHYTKYLEDKKIYCNCDSPRSNFYKYFKENFHNLKLKKLSISGFNIDGEENSCIIEYDGLNEKITTIEGSISYDSIDVLPILEEADIVITNPPFSLFRDFVELLFKYGKDFIILGNFNAVTYKNIFPKIMEREIFLGVHVNQSKYFEVGDGFKKESILKEIDGKKCVSIQNITWFTTFKLELQRVLKVKKGTDINKYIAEQYDNYNAKNYDKLQYLDKDDDGYMGVPITILKYLNPDGYIYVEYEE